MMTGNVLSVTIKYKEKLKSNLILTSWRDRRGYMSTNLYYRLVPKEPKESCFAYQLKFHIAEKLWGHDGSLPSGWTTIGKEWIPYLEGLVSAGNKEVSSEAKKLISLLEKYDEVQLSLM